MKMSPPVFLSSLLVYLILGTYPAKACSEGEPEPTPQDRFDRASSVFVAHVTRVEEDKEPDFKTRSDGTVFGTIITKEVIKGNPPDDNIVKEKFLIPAFCSIPLLAGGDYIFYLDSNAYLEIFNGTEYLGSSDDSFAQAKIAKTRAMLGKSSTAN